MSFEVTTAPTAEPVTLAEMKNYMRLDNYTDDDNLITSLITTARQQIESKCKRALFTQTIDEWQDGGRGLIILSRAPVQTIQSVTLWWMDGTTTAIPAAQYVEKNGSLKYLWGLTFKTRRWPVGRGFRAVEIQYTAGYGATTASVPPGLVEAVKQYTASLYDNRGDAGYDMPPIVDQLLKPYLRMTRML